MLEPSYGGRGFQGAFFNPNASPRGGKTDTISTHVFSWRNQIKRKGFFNVGEALFLGGCVVATSSPLTPGGT